MPLFTFDDLAWRAKQDISGMEARGEMLIADVGASIRLFTGQMFIRGEWTLRTRIRGEFVRLPQRPVHEVISVANIAGDDLSYEWDGIDRIYLGSLAFPDFTLSSGRRPNVVDITYEAGPDEVPPAIVGIGCSIALRTLGVDPMDAAVTQETIDGYSYMLGSAGGAGAYGLLPDEHRTLESFRRKLGTIRTT